LLSSRSRKHEAVSGWAASGIGKAAAGLFI